MNTQVQRLRAVALAVAVAAGASPARAQQGNSGGQVMTEAQLVELLRSVGREVRVQGNGVELTVGDVRMACVWDVTHDRMRILAPVIEDSLLDEGQQRVLLDANFHSALDARYATSGGVLYAVFIHPLSPLRAEEVQSAVRQVASLVKTFGTTYSSGELIFGPPRE